MTALAELPTRPERALLDLALPHPDAVVRVDRLADADAADTWAALLSCDFAAAGRRDPTLRGLFALRALPAHLLRRSLPGDEPMVLARLPLEGPYVRLGERAGREIALGMAGRFWGAGVEWRSIRAADFPTLRQPGTAKIAVSFRVLGDGPRAVVTYECRVAAGDDRTRKAFRRSWWVIRPLARVVMLRQLAAVDAWARMTA